MRLKNIIREYKKISNKPYAQIRSIRRFFVDRTFRIRVEIKCMEQTNFECIREFKRERILKKYGCDISLHSKIGDGISLPHPVGVVIGDDVVIGENCTIYQNTTLGQKNGKYPVIGNNVKIFPSSVIIGGIKIGDNAVIGASSVVLHDVEPETIVAGNPAKELRKANGKE